MGIKQILWTSVVLVLALHMLCRVLTQECNGRGGSEVSNLGWMLQKHIYKKMMAELPHACLLECRTDDRCQSFNWVISLLICEFNNRTKEARPEDFIPHQDRFYFGREKGRVALGSIPELPAETCKEIKASEGQAVNGKYWLSTVKQGMTVLAYCNMDTDDVDECSSSSPVCDTNANCTNTRGSFTCKCKLGYSGDGNICKDIDECSVSPSICDANANCQNNEGSYICFCKVGFVGDGKTCNASSVNVTNSGCHKIKIEGNKGVIQTDHRFRKKKFDCRWNFTSNSIIELVFLELKTELFVDYVSVYNGDSTSAPLIGQFSGSSLPAPITSSGNKLYVRFTSSGTIQPLGFSAVYRAITPGSIRINGSTPSNGQVEIFYDGQWATICSDDWDINDAHVVCRQLGFPQAFSAVAHHGQGSSPIRMGDMACLGNESHIDECNHRGLEKECTHGQDASVQCSLGSVNIRLTNGSANYGRVEVYYKGKWGTVCDDFWDIIDADVVCHQLGFRNASSAPGNAVYGKGTGTIWLDTVGCRGDEGSLFDCPHLWWGKNDCSHGEDASVVCSN